MKYLYLFICILGLAFTSCKNDKEDIVLETKMLTPFETVKLNSAFEVILVQDTAFYLEIEAHEELQKNIEVEQNDKTLSITNSKKLKWVQPSTNTPTLYIHSKKFSSLHANESCNINTTYPITGEEFGLVLTDKANYADIQLDCKVFYYWNNFPCGGKLTLSGKTRELKLWNTAIMSVDAQNLVTEYAIVENESKGVCKVNVLNRLQYKIKGTGDIHLYGDPAEVINEESSSSGQLIIF